ncbi:MAG: hypothetical protein U9Q97_03275 [Acidobacteriota bacterium]|nr:hypothetical protein [Acidobacteriota bacterium]
MDIKKLPDGTTQETYFDENEYNQRGTVLKRTKGTRQIIYEGWLNNKLVRIY